MCRDLLYMSYKSVVESAMLYAPIKTGNSWTSAKRVQCWVLGQSLDSVGTVAKRCLRSKILECPGLSRAFIPTVIRLHKFSVGEGAHSSFGCLTTTIMINSYYYYFHTLLHPCTFWHLFFLYLYLCMHFSH